MSQASQPRSPQLDLDQLLQTAAAAAHGGKPAAARAIFLALSRTYPADARVWEGLAAVAADPAEQRAALSRLVALEPGHQFAREALARLGPDDAAPLLPGVAPAVPLPTAPHEPDSPPTPGRPEDADHTTRTPFPLLNWLALALIVLLLGTLGVVIGRNLGLPQNSASAPLATPLTVATDVPATSPASAALPAASTTPPVATEVSTTLPVALATLAPAAGTAPAITTESPAPSATPATELPLGVVIDYDGWSVTLLQPDYALLLDGAIGDLQPSGRFVLAVVALSNNSPQARPIPPELLTLIDSAERRYSPLPGASSAYLALYGRGQRGDLALEDLVDPLSGMRSVPVLFDVPLDANALRLTTPASGAAGWPISGGAQLAPAGP